MRWITKNSYFSLVAHNIWTLFLFLVQAKRCNFKNLSHFSDPLYCRWGLLKTHKFYLGLKTELNRSIYIFSILFLLFFSNSTSNRFAIKCTSNRLFKIYYSSSMRLGTYTATSSQNIEVFPVISFSMCSFVFFLFGFV